MIAGLDIDNKGLNTFKRRFLHLLLNEFKPYLFGKCRKFLL